ncbi:MAG: PKD domain-containing protein, partial [Bacteroidota bacterium]
MKTITHFRLLAVFCLLLGAKTGFSQCASTITAYSQSCGNANFNAVTAGYSSVTANSFAWDFGDGITTGGTNMPYASHVYTATGVYTVVVSYTNAANTCTSTSSQTVSVFVLPIAFTATQAGNGLVNFANTTSTIPPGTTFLWNFGDQSTSTASSTAHTYTNNGIYYVTLTGYGAAGGYCGTSSSVSVNSGTSCAASMIINPGVSGNVNFSGSAANNTSLTPYGTFSWN